MKNNEFTIAVLGGMGTYATINVFKQYADIFPAEKEWDRPRIIIDNRCTMPSRVRAFLYNENIEKLVDEMNDSLTHLIETGGANVHIILACNTSHLFLPKIFIKNPNLKNRINSIIEATINKIEKDGVTDVYLLGTEGTIESKVYEIPLKNKNITVRHPSQNEYDKLRFCIEAVKQNKYSNEVKGVFCSLVNRQENVILGCTELPILYEKYKESITTKNIYDPVLITLKELKEKYYD